MPTVTQDDISDEKEEILEQSIEDIRQSADKFNLESVITLSSAFLAGYFIHEYREWKEKAMYWYQMYEEVKKK